MSSFLKKSVDSLVKSFDGQLDSLETDTATVDYICDLLVDLAVGEDEKQETIQGIFELHLDPSRARTSVDSSETGDHDGAQPAVPSLPDAVQTLLRAAQTYLSDPAAHDAPRTPSPPPSPVRLAGGREPSPDAAEREQLRRKALLSTYGHIPDPGPPPTSTLQTPREPSSEAPPKELLDQHLKLLDMKKRQRKKAESKLDHPDLLLRPNLNSALIDHQQKLEREQAAKKSKAKAEKDKADLQRQKETQLKKKAEARSKAAKLERKA